MQWSLFLLSLLRVLHFTHMTSGPVGQYSSPSCQPHVYHFVNDPKTWPDAKKYCRDEFTDLATIDNMDDVERLSGSVDYDDNGAAWIGLKKKGARRWHWSLPGREYNECQTHWRGGEPNDVGGKENCVMMSRNGKWYDNNCEERASFICYDERDATDKFHLIEEKKTWRDAQSHCREEHTDLAAVRNQTENQEIKKKMSSEVVWIGLFRDSWMWSDCSNSSFRYWRPNITSSEGEKRCAVMQLSEQDKWSVEQCDQLKPFFCHSDELILIHENMTWVEALEYCRENHHDLVSIHDANIQGWVQQTAKMADTPYVWLGLYYTCTLDYWFWVSGQSYCYQNWAPGSVTGGEECGKTGAVQKDGDHLWVSRPDVEKLNFICIGEIESPLCATLPAYQTSTTSNKNGCK